MANVLRCWSCDGILLYEVSKAKLHHHVGNTWTTSFPCGACGCRNERPIAAKPVEQLVALGVPVEELDPVAVIFHDQLDDEALVERYQDDWARQ